MPCHRSISLRGSDQSVATAVPAAPALPPGFCCRSFTCRSVGGGSSCTRGRSQRLLRLSHRPCETQPGDATEQQGRADLEERGLGHDVWRLAKTALHVTTDQVRGRGAKPTHTIRPRLRGRGAPRRPDDARGSGRVARGTPRHCRQVGDCGQTPACQSLREGGNCAGRTWSGCRLNDGAAVTRPGG